MAENIQSGRPFRAACVQVTAGAEVGPNIEAACALIREAHAVGADLITTPEMVSIIETHSRALFEKTYEQKSDPALRAFSALAGELGVWLLIGSLPIKLSPDKVANRCFLIDATGAIAASYDKIHMFDVDLPDGQFYEESRDYRAGAEAVVAELPWGRLGMSICYDLRFPSLYRALAKAGAGFITIPAAFTRFTGQSHWHILVRARAIETGCFVIAPAQTGEHQGKRETYGHSLIVDPWGKVLADGGTDTGIITANIDPKLIGEARGRVPSLQHDRPFDVKS